MSSYTLTKDLEKKDIKKRLEMVDMHGQLT